MYKNPLRFRVIFAKSYAPRPDSSWITSFEDTQSKIPFELHKELNKSFKRPPSGNKKSRFGGKKNPKNTFDILAPQTSIPHVNLPHLKNSPITAPFPNQFSPDGSVPEGDIVDIGGGRRGKIVPHVEGLISPIDPEDPRYDQTTGNLTELAGERQEMLWEEHEGFHMTLLDMGRPTHLKAKGRIFNSSVTIACGNGKGLGGYATITGSAEFKKLLHAAFRTAKKRAVHIPLFEGRTPYHSFEEKYVSTKLKFWSKPNGYGLQVPDFLRPVCDLIGIKDCGIKIIGSRNRRNVIHCFFKGMSEQSTYSEIARSTGQNMIHAEQTYRRGRLVMFY